MSAAGSKDAPRVVKSGSRAVSEGDAVELLGACAWPAEAFWRIVELGAVRRHLPLPGPVLELGCGDGVFTSLTGLRVDQAIDVQANAVTRARALTGTYRRVFQLDMHDLLSAHLGPFRTVFSNSVLEHVPNLDPVLAACRQLLLPGGRLMITVPLVEMNAHLAVRSRAYAKLRQAQLQHRNLWTLEEWTRRLAAAGFHAIESARYLDGASCRYWDRLDLLGALGIGRYRLAPVAHRLVSLALSAREKAALKQQVARRLLARARAPDSSHCAAVLIASVPE
jgi:SAM-dependent methyltransferase